MIIYLYFMHINLFENIKIIEQHRNIDFLVANQNIDSCQIEVII